MHKYLVFLYWLLTSCVWLIDISYRTVGSITNLFFVNSLYARISNQRIEPLLVIHESPPCQCQGLSNGGPDSMVSIIPQQNTESTWAKDVCWSFSCNVIRIVMTSSPSFYNLMSLRHFNMVLSTLYTCFKLYYTMVGYFLMFINNESKSLIETWLDWQ